MYTDDEKLKAINLFYQYDKSWAPVIRELGYPSLAALKRWIKDYELDSVAFMTPKLRKPKFTNAQRKVALNYYFTHGQYITKTIKALGYPSRQVMRAWLLEDSRYTPTLKETVFKGEVRDETKLEAVEQLYSREKSVKHIANDFEVSRQTIYHWKDVVLGPDFPARKNKK